MLTARHAAIRLVKLMMVASVMLPAMLFAFAAWVSYRNFERVADERINRSLDILHEHALKVLQTIDRTFAEIDEVVRGVSDDNISRNEVWLHDRLKRVVESLPQVQGIAIMDAMAIRWFPLIPCLCQRSSISPTAIISKRRQAPVPGLM